AFGNKGPQIDVAQVDYRHNRRSWRDDFAWFGGAGRDCAVERGDDLQVAAIGLCLLQLRAGAAGFGLGRLDVGLRLYDLLFDGRGLRGANRRVFEIGLGGEKSAARGLDLFSRRLDDGFVRFGGGSRLLAFARRGVALFRQRGEPFGVGPRLFVIGLGAGQRSFGRRDVRLSLTDATFRLQAGPGPAPTAPFTLRLQGGGFMSRAPQTGLGFGAGALRLLPA